MHVLTLLAEWPLINESLLGGLNFFSATSLAPFESKPSLATKRSVIALEVRCLCLGSNGGLGAALRAHSVPARWAA